MKKTLQIELDSFFETIKGAENGITKQEYSEARQKISPTAFIKMADNITAWYYGNDDFKTFNGYRLSAIDGSILELNNSERLRNAFGVPIRPGRSKVRKMGLKANKHPMNQKRCL